MYLITIIPFSDERFLRECTIFICTGVVGFTGRGYSFFGVDLGGGIFFRGSPMQIQQPQVLVFMDHSLFK